MSHTPLTPEQLTSFKAALLAKAQSENVAHDYLQLANWIVDHPEWVCEQYAIETGE